MAWSVVLELGRCRAGHVVKPRTCMLKPQVIICSASDAGFHNAWEEGGGGVRRGRGRAWGDHAGVWC